MDVLLTATLNSGTGLAEDRFVNNWAVGDYDGEIELLSDAISGFYLNLAGGLGALVPMSDFLSGVIDNSALAGLSIRAYDITGKLDGSDHGSPIYTENYTVPVPPGPPGDLPSEIAACITLEGYGRAVAPVEVADGADPDAKKDRPKQRHTGRLYFGPLNSNAVEAVGGIVRISNSFRDTARLAMQNTVNNVRTASVASGELGVWSRKDETIRPLEAVSVDNAVDIVQARGEKASLRERSAIV